MRFIFKEILKEVNDPKRIGQIGEAVLFQLVNLNFSKENIFRNVYLKCNDGSTTEIDIIAIDERGIFVFEMKNYSGYIYGSLNEEYFTQISLNNKKYQVINPVKQNEYHIKCLKQYFNNDYLPFYNIVVVSNHCNLRLKDVNNIIRIKEVKQTLENYKELKLTKEEVDILINQIKVLKETKV